MQLAHRTRNTSVTLRLCRLALGTAASSLVLLTGCGANFSGKTASPIAIPGVAMQGSVFGGQQPVAGAAIQLYAANLTGYSAPSYALLTTSVTTTSGGAFSITGDYTCPSSTSPVYIVATGGSGTSSTSGTNTGLAMMAALGACGSLSAATNININELTTVASAYALSPFMTSPTQLSTSTANTTGLNLAFASVNKLVNTSSGTLPGTSLPAGATLPTAELNTLADILAACINSATGSAPCSALYAAATPAGGTTPSDTVTAMLNIAKHPGSNTAALYSVMTTTPPFQPTLTSAPTDFTVAIQYAPTVGTFSTPSAAALDASGNLWVTNTGNNSITVLSGSSATPTVYLGGGLNAPSGIAFDSTGNAWVSDKGSSQLSVFTSSGIGLLTTATGLSSPSAVAIDGLGKIWVTNSGSNTVTAVTANNTTVSNSTNYGTGNINTPVAIAINPH